MNELTTSQKQTTAATWLAGALIWLPAIAFLALRAALPRDDASVSIVATQPDQVTVVKVAPGSTLQVNDVILTVAGRTVSELLRDTMSTSWRANRTLLSTHQTSYLVQRADRKVAVPVTWQPGKLALGFRRWGILLFGVVFQTVGVFLVLKQPHDPVVRTIFLTAACLLSYSVIHAAELRVSELLFGPSWSLYLLLGIGVNLGWQVGLVWLSMMFPRPHPWLRSRKLWLFTLIALLTAGILLPALITFSQTQNPVRRLSSVTVTLLLAQLTLFTLAVIFFVTNYRSLNSEDRQRARWVMLAFMATLIMGLILSVLPDVIAQMAGWANLPLQEANLRNNLVWIAALGIPVAFAVAIRRHRLFDTDLIINRALVWGALTLLTMGLYVLIVGALSSLFHTSNSPLRVLPGHRRGRSAVPAGPPTHPAWGEPADVWRTRRPLRGAIAAGAAPGRHAGAGCGRARHCRVHRGRAQAAIRGADCWQPWCQPFQGTGSGSSCHQRSTGAARYLGQGAELCAPAIAA